MRADSYLKDRFQELIPHREALPIMVIPPFSQPGSTMNYCRVLLPALAFLLLISLTVAEAGEIVTRALQFAKGHSSATIQGTVKGAQTIDYSLRARAGQNMSVTLKTSNSANYFNVLPPGSNDEAIFVGSTDGNEWAGALPADGDYKVRVYLMRSAARRNEVADYTLTVSITGTPQTSDFGTAPANDAKVEGTPYHATGPLPCTMGTDQPVQCEFGVIRGKLGNAEVHITPPAGLKRVLIFMGDTVTTDAGEEIKAMKQDGKWLIEVNDYEHYRIPEDVIFGG